MSDLHTAAQLGRQLSQDLLDGLNPGFDLNHSCLHMTAHNLVIKAHIIWCQQLFTLHSDTLY